MPYHKKVYLPTTTGGSVRMFHHRAKNINGMGMGSVILDSGMGGQNSYANIPEYIQTTHSTPSMSGRGLDSLSHKLDNLILKTSKRKHKNINFSL